MSEKIEGPKQTKQPEQEETDELNEARVDKFIKKEADKMKAGKSPVFPMSELVKMERKRQKAKRENNEK